MPSTVPLDWTDSVVRKQLDNGLTVLLAPVPGSGTVAVTTHVRAGYFDEPEELIGISHVLEHMYFKGTPNLGPGELAREIKRIGGYTNAGTIYDKTVYYTVIPAGTANLSRALSVAADAVRNPSIDADELRRELEVIIQEALRKLDNPSAVTQERLFGLLFDRHPLQRWRIGSPDVLRTFDAHTVREYHRSRYRPDRTIISIAGDFDPAEADVMVEDSFAAWLAPVADVPIPDPELGPAMARTGHGEGDVSQATWSMGWRTVGPLHEDAPALEVAAALVGRGRGSPLYRSLRLRGFASTAVASHYAVENVGVFSIFAQCDAEHLESAVGGSRRCVERVIEGDIGRQDLDRTRSLYRMGIARRCESSEGRSTFLAEFEALGGVDVARRFIRDIIATDADKVRDVAVRYLSVDPCIFQYLPREVPPLSSAPAEDVQLDEVEVHRFEPDPGFVVRTPTELEVARFDSEGVSTVVQPRSGAGLVSACVCLPWTCLDFDWDRAGISALTTRTAMRGTKSHAAEEIGLLAELLGGAAHSFHSTEYVGWSITVLPEEIPEAVALLDSLAFAAVNADDHIQIERQLQIAESRRLRDDTYRYPLSRVLRQAFAGSVYGVPSLGDDETLSRIRPEDVRTHAARLRGARPRWYFAGECRPDDAKRLVEDLVTQVTGQENGAPYEARWSASADSERRDREQTALAWALPGSAYGAEDRAAVMVLCAALGGLGGRLFERLRSELSLAYAVSISPWVRAEVGAVICYLATSPEREAEAREETFAELGRIRAAGLTEDEIEDAKNYLMGLERMSWETSGGALSRLVSADIYGGDLSQNYELERLRAVRPAAVNLAAERVLDRDEVAEFVMRGRD